MFFFRFGINSTDMSKSINSFEWFFSFHLSLFLFRAFVQFFGILELLAFYLSLHLCSTCFYSFSLSSTIRMLSIEFSTNGKQMQKKNMWKILNKLRQNWFAYWNTFRFHNWLWNTPLKKFKRIFFLHHLNDINLNSTHYYQRMSWELSHIFQFKRLTSLLLLFL